MGLAAAVSAGFVGVAGRCLVVSAPAAGVVVGRSAAVVGPAVGIGAAVPADFVGAAGRAVVGYSVQNPSAVAGVAAGSPVGIVAGGAAVHSFAGAGSDLSGGRLVRNLVKEAETAVGFPEGIALSVDLGVGVVPSPAASGGTLESGGDPLDFCRHLDVVVAGAAGAAGAAVDNRLVVVDKSWFRNSVVYGIH